MGRRRRRLQEGWLLDFFRICLGKDQREKSWPGPAKVAWGLCKGNPRGGALLGRDVGVKQT